MTGDSPKGDSENLKVTAFNPELTGCQGSVSLLAMSRTGHLELLFHGRQIDTILFLHAELLGSCLTTVPSTPGMVKSRGSG